MHFTIVWLINCGEVGRRGFRLQGVPEHVSECETPALRLTPESQSTLKKLQPEREEKFPEVPWLGNAGWEDFSLFVLPPGCTMDCRRWAS